RHASFADRPRQRDSAAVDRAAGPVLPAVGPLDLAERLDRQPPDSGVTEGAGAMSVLERARTAGEVAGATLVAAREDLDHARETGDAVQRPLRSLHHLARTHVPARTPH